MTTVAAPAKTALRHHCSNRATAHCDRGAGRGAKSGKCRTCKSKLFIERGVYGVFAWTGTGHYPLADAIATRLQENAAERVCEAPERAGKGLVVRWVFVGLVD